MPVGTLAKLPVAESVPIPSYGSSQRGKCRTSGFRLVGSHRQLGKFPCCKPVMEGVWTKQLAVFVVGV